MHSLVSGQQSIPSPNKSNAQDENSEGATAEDHTQKGMAVRRRGHGFRGGQTVPRTATLFQKQTQIKRNDMKTPALHQEED